MKVDSLLNAFKKIKTTEQGNTGNLTKCLIPGNILKARVIKVAGSQALLRLPDETLVNALLFETVNLKPGEIAEFVVTAKSGDQLVLKTLKNNEAESLKELEKVISKELRLMNIKVTEQTVQIALAFKNAGMDITRDLIVKVKDGLDNFSGLGIDEAVFLVSAGLEINEENVTAFLQLTRNNYKIGDSLLELIKLLAVDRADNSHKKPRIDAPNLLQYQTGADVNDQALSAGHPILDKIFLRPESSLSEDEIKISYKAVLENLRSLRKIAGQAVLEFGNDILSRIENLENNIRFINELNSCIAYLQIPVSLQQKRTTVQLYVMKKHGSGKSIDPENATLYVSVDTLNMGQVDCLVKVRDKTVSLNLRAENPEVVSFLKINSGLVNNLLLNKGYRLVEYRCSVAEKTACIIEVAALLNREYSNGYGKRKGIIDYRI